jgi:Uroporphyrinogen decarboxylase (URO-D)
MNNRERFLKTVNHEEPDRVMFYTMGFMGHSLNEWIDRVEDTIEDEDVLIDPQFGDRTLRHWLKEDFIEFSAGSTVGYPRVHVEGNRNTTIGPFGRIMDHSGEYAGRPYSWYVGPHFDTLEKREEFYNKHGAPWDEKFAPKESSWKDFERKMKHIEEENFKLMPVSRVGCMWEYIFEGIGPKLIAYLMRKKPNTMHKIIEENTRSMKIAYKRMLEAGALCIGISDDMGQKGRPLMSPKNFDTFLAPVYKELTDIAHKAGGYFWLHSCGNITELLPSLVDSGVDLWQALEPASGVDIREVKEKYGDKMTFVGGLDSSRIIPFGTKEEVIKHVEEYLEVALPGGGYIAGPSHDVMDIPLDNFLAMRDTIFSKGKY